MKSGLKNDLAIGGGEQLKSTLAILTPRALVRKESEVFPLMLAQEEAERVEAAGER